MLLAAFPCCAVGDRQGYRIFTDAATNHTSDCRCRRRFAIVPTQMSLLVPIDTSPAEKLDLLQRLDRYRKWQALDDKRYCLACGQIIRGEDVLIVGGTRGTGPLRLVCPTAGCHSIPMDWVIPTDKVLERLSILEEQELPSIKSARPSREKFYTRLRRFATHFRPAA